MKKLVAMAGPMAFVINSAIVRRAAQKTRKKPAPVTKLQELPQGKAACFAPAVQAISGQRHEYAERGCDGSPETDRETGLVELFGVCHKRNHG